MAAFVQDSFTDTNATALQSHTGETGATWAKLTGFTRDAQIQSNVLENLTNSDAAYYASGAPASADYEVELDYSWVNSGLATSEVLGRMDTSTGDFYSFYYRRDANQYRLRKRVGGTYTTLSSVSGSSPGSGVYINHRLALSGSNLEGFADDVSVLTATDSSLTAAGKAGLAFTSPGSTGPRIRVDNFLATEADGGSELEVTATASVETLAGLQAAGALRGDYLATVERQALLPSDHLATMVMSANFWADYATALERLAPSAYDSLVGVGPSAALQVDVVRELRRLAAMVWERGARCLFQSDVTVQWNSVVVKGASAPIEFSRRLMMSATAPVEWAGEAVFEVSAEAPLEFAAGVAAALIAPVEYTKIIITDCALPAQLMSTVITSRDIVRDSLARLSTEITLPTDWSSVLIVTDALPAEWHGQSLYVDGNVRLFKADQRGRVFSTNGRVRLFRARRVN